MIKESLAQLQKVDLRKSLEKRTGETLDLGWPTQAA